MRVIKKFRDKFTKKIYSVGDSYSHPDVDRLVGLVGAGYLAPDPEPKDVEEAAEELSYQLMTKKELEEILDQRGIEYTKRMSKAEMIELLK